MLYKNRLRNVPLFNAISPGSHIGVTMTINFKLHDHNIKKISQKINTTILKVNVFLNVLL